MIHPILVVTPSVAFGELIRQSLARNGDLRVQVCQSANEALVLCRGTLFAIAILDADLANQSLPRLGQEIQRRCLGVRLVVFPPDNNPKSPALAGGDFQAYLKKPFYLPSLQKTINKLLGDSAPPDGETPDETGSFTPPAPEAPPADPEVDMMLEEIARFAKEPPVVSAKNPPETAWPEPTLPPGFRAPETPETPPANPEGDMNGEEIAWLAKEPPVRSSENPPETAWPEPTLPPGFLAPETPEEEAPEAEPALDLQELGKMGLGWITSDESLLPPGDAAQAQVPVQMPEQPVTADSHVRDTQPMRITAAPAMQIFTCALTPLLAEHYLRSGQVNALRKAMLEISAGQGWQMLWLSIRPSHVAWTVRIPASSPPETMLKAYRQDTSEGLFRAYPSFGYQNPSGDFWSPGGLLNPGERSLSRQAIYEFVAAAHPSSPKVLHPS